MAKFELEPFYVFRTTLFVALTAYYVLTITAAVWRVTVLLRGSDPQRRLLRVYLSYHLVSFRVRPLAGELIQIGVWGTILALLWWLHQHI